MSSTVTPIPDVALTKPARRRSSGGAAASFQGQANWVVKLVVIIVCFLWLVPTIGILVTSFRTPLDAESTGWWTVLYNPSTWSHFTTRNYTDAIKNANLGTAVINSFAITLPATFIPILIAAFAAYAFTFMQFPGRDVLFIIIVGLLVVPNLVALVPLLKLYSPFTGEFLQFPKLWLAHVGFGMPLAVYLLRNYMVTLPREVIESAKIDGASHFQTFWRLILPMSTPALAAFAIFQFLWVWNDLLVALVILGPDQKFAPITVAVKNNLLGQQGGGWNLVTAGGLISMVVPVAIFLAMQRYFVRGLTAGSVKG
jgi:alpha-glucoside transport system permease protein